MIEIRDVRCERINKTLIFVMKPAGFILCFVGFKCAKMSQRVILHSKDFSYLLNKSGSREYSYKDKEWFITSHYFRFELIIESQNIYRNATLVWAHMYVTRCWWYLSIRNVYMLSPEDSTYGSLMQTGVYYTNIDCSRLEWWKIVVPEMKFNLDRLFTKAGSSRPRLNVTEGTIIFYHSVSKKSSQCLFHTPHS